MSEAAVEDEPSFASHFIFEAKFGARKQTHRYVRVIDGSKTTRAGSGEAARY
jgi:hypothetical protein